MADPVRVIDVFLVFHNGDRNFVKLGKGKHIKTTMGPIPDWTGLQHRASKLNFQVNVLGPPAVVTAKIFTDSLQNSEATILIGHGASTIASKKWVTNHLNLFDGKVVAPGTTGPEKGQPFGLYLTKDEKTINHPSRPQINKVTGIFTCNSHDVLPRAFDIPWGSVMVTNDGGEDGLTRVGTLENTGFAFVEAYINSKGDVVYARGAAQKAMNKGGLPLDTIAGRIPGSRIDQGDSLQIELSDKPDPDTSASPALP